MKNKKLLAKYSLIGYYEKTERVAFEKVHTDLRRLPQHIVKKLLAWAHAVELNGKGLLTLLVLEEISKHEY